MVRAEAITRENVFVAVCCGVKLSVAVTAMPNVPALVGVPPSVPAPLIVIPGGRPVAVQLYGVAPPCACMVTPEYARLTNPAGSDAVVMVRAETMVIVNVFEAVCCGAELSVTVTFNVYVPAVANVPEIVPPVKVIPAGRPLMDHVYGVIPPCT
jgi:hypothetical protein